MEGDLNRGARPRDLMRALLRAGFQEVRTHGDHRIFRHPTGIRATVSDTVQGRGRHTQLRLLGIVRKALREAEARSAEGV